MDSNFQSEVILKKPDYRNFLSDRIKGIPHSFIREILKVAISDNIISFAGGLPDRDLFPYKELESATQDVFNSGERDILQYSNSEGYLPLREIIAERYRIKQGLKVRPEDILITSGSQQGLDLIGKVLLNEGDRVIIEEPGYLGAIQAFSVYNPLFVPVPLNDDGIDINRLTMESCKNDIKLMYSVPDFQNPSGISYSPSVRKEVMETASKNNFLIIEDTPYSELRFHGETEPSLYSLCPQRTVLLGTFSKTIAPSFRIGWIVAPDEIMEKLLVAKQASDLHTNFFTQKILYQYLTRFNIDEHIEEINLAYGAKCKVMSDSIRKYFPDHVGITNPEGGMFLWITLPGNISSFDLFTRAIKKKVAFVPGNPFYINRNDSYPTLRLNFSCSSFERIEEGIKRLSKAYSELMNQ